MGDRAQKGQAIVIIALIFAVLCGMLALAIDGGRAFVTRRQVQNAADASASAGARTYSANASSSSAWVTAETAQGVQYARNRGLTFDASRCSPGLQAPSANASFATVCSFAADASQLLEIVDTDEEAPLNVRLFQSQGVDQLATLLIQVVGGGPSFGVNAAGIDWASLGGFPSGPLGGVLPPGVSYGSPPSGWEGPWPPCLSGCGVGGGGGGSPSPGPTPTSNPTLATPVVLSLSTGCGSPSDSMTISGSSGQAAVVGNVVSWGDIATGSSSVPIAGDTTWTCGSTPSAIQDYCYPSGAQPPCTSPDVSTSAFLGGQPSGPNFTPASSGSTSQALTALNVNLQPGVYGSALQLGMGSYQNGCWFLAGGAYAFQAQFNDQTGITSNELRPPDEPVPGSITSRANPQFWRQNGARCDGSFAVSAVADTTGLPLGIGTYAVRLTSVRTDNGVTRQSAPSMCRTLSVATPSAIQVNVSNVPGATDYYVYLSTALWGGGTCSSPSSTFIYTADLPTPGLSTETNADLSGCPSTTSTSTCSLGVTTGTVDQVQTNAVLNLITLGSQQTLTSLSELRSPVSGSGFADQDPAMGSDSANWGLCVSSAAPHSTVACPNSVTQYDPTAYLTPGAVQLQESAAGCFNFQKGSGVNGPLPYLFSGYQYAWALALQPMLGSSCNDYFEPAQGSDSEFLGHIDVPQATGEVTGTSPYQPTVYGTFTAYQVVLDGTNGVAVYFVPPPDNTSGYGVCLYC